MRIIGEIPHTTYKISLLHMNDRVTIQIEDRLLSQSFTYRDGSGVSDFESAKQIVTNDFLSGVDKRFKSMQLDYIKALESSQNEADNELMFDII